MGEPCSWTLPACGCGGCVADLPPAQRTRANALATVVVWGLTGRQYGLCDITVQPCTPNVGRSYQVYPVDMDMWGGAHLGFHPVIENGVWRNVGTGSCCSTGCEVDLPGPVVKANVIEVRVAGVLVDPDAYQVHDRHLLVRIDGGCWPVCVNYGSQSPPDFTVRYRRGTAVPSYVLEAAAVLACEFGKACQGLACRLPSRVSSLTRQGVDVQFADWTDLFEAGLTGIDEVDRVILTVNPGRRASPPEVWTPDLPPPRMVT